MSGLARSARWLCSVMVPLWLSACGGGAQMVDASDAPRRCTRDTTHRGDLVLTNDDEVEAAAACRTVTGDLVLRGGALSHASVLGVTEVTGDVRVGPAMRLASVVGLGSLRVVGGSLVVHKNLSLRGVYLRQLRSIGGSLIIEDNADLGAISAPQLARVSGKVLIARNSALRRLELLVLQEIRGGLQLADNAILDQVVVPARPK